MKQNQISPPRWAEKILSWYCKPELLEDLQGDLYEYFLRNVVSKGLAKARLIYVIDVLKFFRTYTVRKPKFLNPLIEWIMIGSYVKTSARSIFRNRLFSAINIVGLAISMSAGLVLIGFLTDLSSYDDFHVNKDKIYRVISTHQFQGDRAHVLASSSIRSAKKIKESVSGVEEVSVLRPGFSGNAHFQDRVVPVSASWADENFFKIFSFPLLKGDAKTALKNPYSIILTEDLAKKIFREEEALGRSVMFDSTDYIVTGVLKNIPRFSHLQFSALVSFSTFEEQMKNDHQVWKWADAFQNYSYVLLDGKTDAGALKSTLDQISKAENAPEGSAFISIELQPMKDFVAGRFLENMPGPSLPKAVVWVLAALALIVIISACFNYTNLSIARSIRRSKEIGVRKVIGASKRNVIAQFVAESVIISLMSLVFAFLLFLLIRPHFTSMIGINRLVTLELSWKMVSYFIAMAMTTGVVAGMLPAIFFSKINPVQALKSTASLKVFRHVNLRKSLVTIQYTFSLMFLATAIIINTQYRFFTSVDFGFNTENVLNINMQGNKADLLIKELSEIPEVTATSKSLIITSAGNITGTQLKYKTDSAGVYMNAIDENYVTLHGHTLVAGRNLLPQPENVEKEILVNEEVLRKFKIADANPEKAIGEVVVFDGHELQIAGVLKDFYYFHPKGGKKTEPVVFRYARDLGMVNVKISSTDLRATLEKVDQAWKKIDPVHTLNATWYDQQIAQNYQDLIAMVKIIGFLSFLTVSIASMGLFGMVVYTTEARMKEISVRKIFGASEGGLLLLLSRGFLFLLLIAACIAIPLVMIFFEKVVFTSIPSYAPINVPELFIGVLVVMLIAFSTIGWQTFSATRSNPAEVLKNE